MRAVALLIALLIIVIGLVGLVTPEYLQAISRYSTTQAGLYVAAAVRLAIGGVLISVARGSRAPNLLRVVGILAIVAGVITVFMGVDRARAIAQWSYGPGQPWLRVWAGIALLFGAVIAYAVTPRRRAE